MVNRCPAKTGYWSSLKSDLWSTNDMCRLMGLMPDAMDWRAAGLTETEFRTCLGNGCSLSVLSHLIPEVLLCAGMTDPTQVHQMASNRRKAMQALRVQNCMRANLVQPWCSWKLLRPHSGVVTLQLGALPMG